jgi:hypothetical protein
MTHTGTSNRQTDLESIAGVYFRFATEEAYGRSNLYEQLSHSIAKDQQVLSLIARLPAPKRQPNLLFASYRSLFGTPSDWDEFRGKLMTNWAPVSHLIMQRSTQTNEPARCATLLPVLAQLPGPLALIEVGASAGLCLLPDQYGYDYDGRLLLPEQAQEGVPVFKCRTTGRTPIPDEMPKIAWRAGLDLEPISLDEQDRVRWLEQLIWPGQSERQTNFEKAIALARRAPPRVVRGDLRSELEGLCAEAPSHCTKVVFHSAALFYVHPQADREEFATTAMKAADYWLSNESPSVFPEVAKRTASSAHGMFLLSLNKQPVAWTDPHGASIQWLH